MDVKNGANLLDRLVKDVVTESATFDVHAFVPLLHMYIRKTNPFIRQLLVGWIMVLNNVPDINMLDWLPEFLEGLLEMLGDVNRNIRTDAHNVLNVFLEDLKTAEDADLGAMVPILTSQCSAANKLIRHTALSWLQDLIVLGRSALDELYAVLLGAVLNCISDSEPDIRQLAASTNGELLLLVGNGRIPDIEPLLDILTERLQSEDVATRMASLKWINMLLGKARDTMRPFIGDLLPALLKTLKDASDDVVLMNLEVLARISAEEAEFHRVLNTVMALFAKDQRLLEARGSVIVRRLCVLLDPTAIYMALARALGDASDAEFVSLLIHTLNLILLTASELQGLRDVLKRCFQPGSTSADGEVFRSIFTTWSHNPVSTFALCLLAQAYDLAFDLVKRFANIEITVGFLMQADKLVQLLESPIYVHLRLQLLDVDATNHASLVKALYGLLMLLPQSNAFRTLSSRLQTIGSLHQHLGTNPSKAKPKSGGLADEQRGELLAIFDRSQERLARARRDMLATKSLASEESSPIEEKAKESP